MYFPLPSIKKPRAASIGFGNRSDFVAGSKSKCPVFYDFKSDFNHGDKKVGFSMGLGRQDLEGKFDPEKKKMPGPQHYDIRKDLGKDSIHWKFGDPPEKKKRPEKIPGDVIYDNKLQFNPQGKYQFSRYRNPTNVIWSADLSPRWKDPRKKIIKKGMLAEEDTKSLNGEIGPGYYPPVDFLKNKGNIFISKYKSNVGKTIALRFEGNPSKYHPSPGPGTYIQKSDWGIYESKNKEKRLEEEKIKFPPIEFKKTK